MTNPSGIERIVMRRVRLIRMLGLLISTSVLATLTAVAALWGIGKEVWVARVFENVPTGFDALVPFYVSAFLSTSLIIQVLTILTFISFVYLARETVRLLASLLIGDAKAHRR